MSPIRDPAPDMWTGFDADTADSPPVWEAPVPLAARRELPVYPSEVLPGWLRDYTEAVAEETQTPVDLAGCFALVALATAAGGRAVVHVRGRWREPLNLFTVVALPPGNRKSAVVAAMTDPLYEAEKRLKERAAPAIIEASITARLARESADKAAEKAARASGAERDQLVADAVGMAQTAETVTVPVEPQLLADDATAETATTRMAEQGGRIAVVSAEGGIFDIVAGRYSGTPNMEVFLKGHAGDRLRVDRQNRREYIDHPALTMGLAVQPSVLDDIGRNTTFKGRGLLGRFLYSMPVSLLGRRKTLTAPVPEDIAEAYERNVIALTLSLADWTDPALLQLTPEADAALKDFQDRLEPQLDPRGRLGHMGDWAGKLAGATARIAGLLHLAEHLEHGHARPVTEATMLGAVALADYFTAHALTVFDAMGVDPTVSRARTVLELLRAHGWAEISKRDLMVKLSRAEFPTVADLEHALDHLEDHGYVRLQPVRPTGGRGRPPSPKYLTHPTLHTPTT